MVLGMVGILAVPAFAADQSDSTARQYERAMAKVSAIRQEANRYRDGEGVKKNVARAKELDRQADALEAKARRVEPAAWPPSDVAAPSPASSSSSERSVSRSRSMEERAPAPAAKSAEDDEQDDAEAPDAGDADDSDDAEE
jgi:hypothetical protein